MGLSIADLSAANFATIGVLMAMEARHRTGLGQMVDTSLLESQVSLLSYHLTSFSASGKVPQRRGGAGQVNVPYQAFKTSDDWVVIAAFNDRMWRSACAVLGHPEWADDERFYTANVRIQNRETLLAKINAVLSTQPAAHWERVMVEAGVPCTRVNRIDQIVEEEQVRQRDMIVEMEVPNLGPIRMAGLPIKFDQTPDRLDRPPPGWGSTAARGSAA